jgi:N-glycosylase/DNA lyase
MIELAGNVPVADRLRKVIQESQKLLSACGKPRPWQELSETELWEALCLCILSSSVLFETAKSAFLQLREKGILDIRSMSEFSAKDLEFELSRPVYLPRRKNGSFRRYRFPKARAIDIVGAYAFLYIRNEGLHSILRTPSSDIEMRGFLAKNIHGVGLKQASHFLRNVNYSASLAIIDCHIIRFLSEKVLEESFSGPVTPKQYLEMEQIMIETSRRHGLNPALLDIAIWNHMRSEHP